MVGVINAPTDGSQTIAMFSAAAANVGKTVTPSSVQGGSVGPAKAVSSSSSSSAATTSSTAKSAGIEGRGVVQWSLMSLTGLAAIGFGSLIL